MQTTYPIEGNVQRGGDVGVRRSVEMKVGDTFTKLIGTIFVDIVRHGVSPRF